MNDQDMTLLPPEGREAGKPLKFPSSSFDPKDADDNLDWTLDWYSSPKLDGNRCLVIGGQAFTSSMRPFRNVRLKEAMGKLLELSRISEAMIDLEIYDEEGSHHAHLSGALNSYCDELPQSMKFYLFDTSTMDSFYDQCSGIAFQYRMERVMAIPGLLQDRSLYVALPQRQVSSGAQIADLFQQDLDNGYEGSILRSGRIHADGKGKTRGGFYKHGRATINQQIGFKIKSFVSTDGQITDVIQRRVLDPEKMANLGIDRSSNPDGTLARVNNKDAYSLTDMVGAFKVKYTDEDSGEVIETEISFANGYDHTERRRLWSIRDELLGRWVEFTHMPHGSLDKARHGRLVRFRPDLDMV